MFLYVERYEDDMDEIMSDKLKKKLNFYKCLWC